MKKTPDSMILFGIIFGAAILAGVVLGVQAWMQNKANEQVVAAVTTSTQTVVPSETTPEATATIATTAQKTSTIILAPAPKPTSSLPVATSTPAPAPAPQPVPPPAPPTVAQTSAPASSTPVITLPYSIGTFGDAFKSGDGWDNWWGNISQNDGTLIVAGTASSTGGGAWLNGSEGWNGYTMQATVDWLKGESFGIAAQYVDGSNYVLCDFDETTVGTVSMSLRQYVAGKETSLATGKIMNYNQQGGANIKVALSMQGKVAICAFNGHAISSLVANTAVSPAQNGGIAFTAWDPNFNNSEIVIHNIGVVKGSYDLGLYDDQN